MGNSYAPIVILWVLTMGLAAVLLSLSIFLGRKSSTERKTSPYESGITPVGEARGKFPVNYYLVGALFIVFDIEAVFLIAWAVVSREFGIVAVIELAAFLLVIIVGYFYVLRSGVLDWR